MRWHSNVEHHLLASQQGASSSHLPRSIRQQSTGDVRRAACTNIYAAQTVFARLARSGYDPDTDPAACTRRNLDGRTVGTLTHSACHVRRVNRANRVDWNPIRRHDATTRTQPQPSHHGTQHRLMETQTSTYTRVSARIPTSHFATLRHLGNHQQSLCPLSRRCTQDAHQDRGNIRCQIRYQSGRMDGKVRHACKPNHANRSGQSSSQRPSERQANEVL